MRYSRNKQEKGTFDGDRSIERNKTSCFKSELILAYDNACAICGEYAGDNFDDTFLEAHHIKRVADGGKTCYENMVLLCPTCHEKAHKGIISYAELHRHTIDKSVVLSKLQNRINKFRMISENKTLKQDDLFDTIKKSCKPATKHATKSVIKHMDESKEYSFIIQKRLLDGDWTTMHRCVNSLKALRRYEKIIMDYSEFEVRLIQTNEEAQA